MPTLLGRVRLQLPGIIAVLAIVAGYFLVLPPTTSAAEQDAMASHFHFTPLPIELPPAAKQQTIRTVNKDYEHIRAWISSVGAAITMTDLRGTGKSGDLCLVDTRTDQVDITPVPGSDGPHYAPFALDPAPLPMNDYIAPMGCVAGDFNEDGHTDLLVYYWGRTPILFLAKPDATTLDAHAFEPVELVPGPNATDGKYTGAQWNTNTASIADFDGDGHHDIFIGNYFPDGPVLDDRVSGGVVMNHSMSHAENSGGKYICRWTGGNAAEKLSAKFECSDDAFPEEAKHGWSLASSSIDLDGRQLPDLYVANDFGNDRMLYNVSTPGHPKFQIVTGPRDGSTPKSKILGNDSFKGMGVDFGDLDGKGLYDLFVSNITTSFGIEESNFQFMNTARDKSDLRAQLSNGTAPFVDRSAEDGTAWSGWGWDVKMGDFDNSGRLAIVQATGFVKGETNRWPQLQELATANDALLDNPWWWPNVKAGDDIGGDQTLRFFVKGDDGHYSNLAGRLGLAVPVPTRGIATGDAYGNGKLDFAVARQWDAPVFYRNDSPDTGSYLDLRLTHDTPDAAGPMPAPGSPVIGAEVEVTTPDGRKHIDRVDGGSGHSGKRSHDVHLGLGKGVTGPLPVKLQWRARDGQVHEQTVTLTPGSHWLQLGSQAKEK